MPMSAEIEKDDAFFPLRFSIQSLIDGSADGVGSFWGRQDAFVAGKENCGFEGCHLGNGNCTDHSCFHQAA